MSRKLSRKENLIGSLIAPAILIGVVWLPALFPFGDIWLGIVSFISDCHLFLTLYFENATAGWIILSAIVYIILVVMFYFSKDPP